MHVTEAKLAILCGSITSAVLGLLYFYLYLKRVGAAGGTTEAADAAEAAVGIAAGGEAPTAGDAEAAVDVPDADGARRDG